LTILLENLELHFAAHRNGVASFESQQLELATFGKANDRPKIAAGVVVRPGLDGATCVLLAGLRDLLQRCAKDGGSAQMPSCAASLDKEKPPRTPYRLAGFALDDRAHVAIPPAGFSQVGSRKFAFKWQAVSDRGAGMPAEICEVAFARFVDHAGQFGRGHGRTPSIRSGNV
jgi:hypothetical protein